MEPSSDMHLMVLAASNIAKVKTILLRKLFTLDATAHAAHIFMEVYTCLQYGGSWLDSAFRDNTLGIGSSGQDLYSSYFLSTHLFGDLPPLTDPNRGSLGFGVQQSPT
eukprot:Gb_11655 [translate_table: standard]